MAYFFPTPQLLPGFSMASDASGHDMVWAHVVQVQWSAVSLELPIALKELLPILISGVVWGHGWYDHRIECLCDNQAVIACLQSRTSRHRVIMHNLFFIEDIFGFHIYPKYIDTHSNHLADDLSRNCTTRPRGPPTGPPSRLNLSAMVSSVQGYLNQGLAQSTQRSYNAANMHFCIFCRI